jgi:uncharacterized protein YmfQ (DUF2313 family)
MSLFHSGLFDATIFDSETTFAITATAGSSIGHALATGRSPYTALAAGSGSAHAFANGISPFVEEGEGEGIPTAPRLPAVPVDRHVRRGQEEYSRAFSGLLPLGVAWPREIDSVLAQFVFGLAGVWGFVDGRAGDLLERESDPRQSIELLPDWERAWGLPDPCYAEPLGIDERHRHLMLRMTMIGGQSQQFFIDIASFLGYEITISEFRPFMIGLDWCGAGTSPLAPAENYGMGDAAMRFYWTVHVHAVRLVWFRVAAGQVGIDPHLRIALATDLECVIRRWKPAHTEVIFDYSGVSGPGDPMAGTP